ncbi:MAG: hypothetical protein LBT56_02735 [Prevotellaceae bacterium]|jgi:hypothetical protein|nr:hypothetical protein [Prevotellaceae bacterium]
MKIEPVRYYKSPDYPTIERYVYNPREFLRHTPHSWFGNTAVWTALVAFSIGGNSCKDGKKPAKNGIEIVDTHENEIQQKKNSQKRKSFVAPVFIHGEGVSAFGCVVIAPPVIISEQDAMQIIVNELNKHNIKLDVQTDKSINLHIKKYETTPPLKNKTQKDVVEEMKFDGYNADLNFVVEFVSSNDCAQFADDEEYLSSVSVENYKELAKNLRNQIVKEKNLNAVVFYDPACNIETNNEESFWDNYDKYKKKAQKKSKKLLIQQVEDFVEWLKTEKIY